MRPIAFTLIELLVVISILAMLMALVFPVFASSREQAQAVTCRTNVHQLLLSLHNYESEHQSLPYGFDFKEGARPPGGYVGDFGFPDRAGWWWFHSAGVIPPRLPRDSSVLHCPSKKLENRRLDLDVLCGNYGVNRSLCRTATAMSKSSFGKAFVGPPLSTSNLHHPGSTLLVVDSGYVLISWWQATAEPPAPLDDSDVQYTAYVPGLGINKDRSLWPGQASDAVGGRHPNKTVNIGFADGHADSRPAGDLLVEKTEEGYTNALLWHVQQVCNTDSGG